MKLFKREKKDSRVLAEEFFAKGQWANALAAYEELYRADVSDVKLVRRVADLRLKTGKIPEAVEAYRTAADLYAGSGFLVQAIAVYKVLLKLDPTAEDVARGLGELYAERGITEYGREKYLPKEEGAPASEEAPRWQRPLPRIPLFSDLPEDAFLALLDRVIAVELGGGDCLFSQGDPGDSLFVVASGAVEVHYEGRTLATLEEGDFFGEFALLNDEPRSSDVCAAFGGAQVLEIRREDVEHLMLQYPSVLRALQAFCKRRATDRMLAVSTLMDDLDNQTRLELESLLEVVNVPEGTVLIREGSFEQDLYFVTKGGFEVSTLHPLTGRKVVLATIGPGHFFGEVALITSGERTATVQAQEDSEVLKVSRETLLPYLERYPVILKALEKAREERAEAAVNIVLGKKY